jgi:hypothetical protein
MRNKHQSVDNHIKINQKKINLKKSTLNNNLQEEDNLPKVMIDTPEINYLVYMVQFDSFLSIFLFYFIFN